MTVFMLIIEALAACLFVLLPCVIGISNGAVNLVCLYEKEVQQRVVEYNGPRNPDHIFQNHREHGMIKKTQRRDKP